MADTGGIPAGQVANTVMGRNFVRQLGHPLAVPLKWLMTRPFMAVVDRHKAKVIYTAIVALVVARLRVWRKQRELARLQAAQEAAAKAAAPAVPENMTSSGPGVFGRGAEIKLPTTFELLRSPEGNMGFAEFAGSIGLVVAASAVMIRKAVVLGQLLARQNDAGFSRAWARLALQYPFLCLANVFFMDSVGFFKRRIQLKWRTNVTNKLHSLYFSRMRYYRIMNEEKDLMLSDPDIRICGDVRDLISAVADVVMNLIMASFFTLMFGSATISKRDWKWSLASPFFFVVAFVTMSRADPPEIYQAYGALQHFNGRLSQMLTRVQLHAERICMLKGESFELNNLNSSIAECSKYFKQICNLSFLRNAMNAWFFSSPDGAATIECTAMFICTCMGANDVSDGAAKAGSLASLPLDLATAREWTGDHMAIMMRDMHGFFNACSGWGSFMGSYMALKDFHHITGRVKELYYRLQLIKEARVEQSVFEDKGPVISFDNVTIQTPMQQVLLEGLTFTVEQGQTLLICGHNGAGKSSIIRSLCSLWPIPAGSIARPGGYMQAEEERQLHDEVYYLPQKPCNVLGSLSDQLTYPLSPPGGLPKEELRRWLRYVGLEYLVDRKIGAAAMSRVKGESDDINDIDWEVLLSMGEQQALSIARLLYHHPRFAILDECTSAVGKELERRLFEVAKELGITCITITHRPYLKEHHGRLLQLTGEREQDGKGWHISDLHEEGVLPPTKPRCSSQEEVHERIQAYLEKNTARLPTEEADAKDKEKSEELLTALRSSEYARQESGKDKDDGQLLAEDVVLKRWPNRFARFWAVVRLGLRTKEDKRKAMKRLAIMAVVLRIRVSTYWFYWRGQTGMLMGSFAGERVRVFAEYFAVLLTTTACSYADQYFRNQSENLLLEIWEKAMETLPKRVLSNAALLKMMNPPDGSNIPKVENPALRLLDIKGVFDFINGQINDVIIPLFQGIALVPSMVTGLGSLSPLMLLTNFLLFRGSQLIAPNFPLIQKRTQNYESRFQVLHTRLRTIAEPVAFSGGGNAERRIIEPHFQNLQRHLHTCSRQETLYNMMVTAFTDYRQFPLWTQRLASIRFAKINSPESQVGISPSILCCNFLFDRTIQFPQVAVQKVVKLTEASGRLDGQCSRILELVVACDAIDALPQPQATSAPEGSTTVVVKGLDLVTQRGVCLAKGLSFELEAGVPMVCTGPNAAGKSLLGSVLLGLWAASGKGVSISIPGATGPRPPLKTIMPAPQQVYLPFGMLVSQLSYPVPIIGVGSPPILFCKNMPENADEGMLYGHFAPYGCNGVKIEDEAVTDAADNSEQPPRKKAILSFTSMDGAHYVIARPQDRVIDGKEMEIEIANPIPGIPGEVPNLTRMRRCLRAVGIDHILTREPIGWLTEKEWCDSLSGGEQQRLCVARVLYHGPVFGLLDECTSMVAADAEQNLYRVLFKEWGITPLTLTQRLFMPDFYQWELGLGIRSEAGWELIKVASDEK